MVRGTREYETNGLVEPPEKYSNTLWINRSQANCRAYSSSVTGQVVRNRMAVNTHSTVEKPRVTLSCSHGIGRSINEADTLARRVWLFDAGAVNYRSSAPGQCVANV